MQWYKKKLKKKSKTTKSAEFNSQVTEHIEKRIIYFKKKLKHSKQLVRRNFFQI